MARGLSVLGLQGVVAMAAAVAVAAPPRCAAQATSCTASILSLAPCLSFTAGNTSPPPPSASCCSALAAVVRGAPRCLCAVLGGGASFGVTVNATRALELPGKCKVTTPPVSQCNAAPAASPSAPAPAATAVEAPTAPPPVYRATGAAGSKATPATGAASSHAGGITGSAAVSVSLVAAIAFASVMAF
ncbi:unnamed protein product [Urochloa decumbens]|uniref:Bifunctional inhibitor/plant lipid transfer protein/seed storage helical domain-containing protein n=1 Tax=Urochloa decumbens TaxID=240449 RepID=A0ABC9F0Y0_9POAL